VENSTFADDTIITNEDIFKDSGGLLYFNIGADNIIGKLSKVADGDVISYCSASEFSTFADSDVISDDGVGEFGVVVDFRVIADLHVAVAFCSWSDSDIITDGSVISFCSFGMNLEGAV